MKRIRIQFRVFLMMLTIGLASVPFTNTLYEKWTEIPVSLPQVESESPIIVILPAEGKPFNISYGAGCGGVGHRHLNIKNKK